MRMFVAIDLSRQIIEGCKKIISSLNESGSNLKAVKPENLHITLKFLGEVREDEVEKVCESLADISGEFEPFRIGFSGLGFFGSRKFPKVIWIGISDGMGNISKLCRSLEDRLSWVRREGRKSNPHLTLARLRNPRGSDKIGSTLEGLGDVKLGEFDVKEIKLKSSTLTPDGPVYSDFKVFELGKGSL